MLRVISSPCSLKTPGERACWGRRWGGQAVGIQQAPRKDCWMSLQGEPSLLNPHLQPRGALAPKAERGQLLTPEIRSQGDRCSQHPHYNSTEEETEAEYLQTITLKTGACNHHCPNRQPLRTWGWGTSCPTELPPLSCALAWAPALAQSRTSPAPGPPSLSLTWGSSHCVSREQPVMLVFKHHLA